MKAVERYQSLWSILESLERIVIKKALRGLRFREGEMAFERTATR